MYQPVDPGTTRLILPVFNTIGRSVLALSFKHAYNSYAPGVGLKIQTSTDGMTWTDESWSIAANAGIEAETVTAYITHNLNSGSTFIAFVQTGNLNNSNGWFIDDVVIEGGNALPARVDFDGDGQEDILWRYQGSGAYQGMNVIWLMGQSEALAPTPLATDLSAREKPSVVTGSKSWLGTANLSGISSWTPSSLEGVGRSVLDGTAELDLSKVDIARTPLEQNGLGSRIGGSRRKDVNLADIHVTRDAFDVDVQGPGEVTIAALELETELVFSQVSDLGWQIAGAGDFDGDSDTDILWRYYGTGAYQGLNVIWYMAGSSRDDEVVINQIPDTNWRIVGTGDFDGDSDTDILWRYHGTGAFQGLNVIWYMAGTSYAEVVFSQVLDTNWQIASAADFDGDSDMDILWRYYGPGAYQGLNLIWYMTGTTRDSEVVFSQVLDTNWQIAGTGDFDGDSNTDILWRYYSTGAFQGLNVIWYMTGASRNSDVIFGQIPDTNWRIVNR